MKAAIFTQNISGGAFLHVSANTAHCLSIIGLNNLDVVYIDGTPESIAKYFPGNTNFVKLKSRRILFSIPPLIHYLLRNKPDIVVSMPAYVNMAAIITKILIRFFWHGKLIITEHATMSKKIIEHKNELFMGNIDKLARILYRHADALVGVSKGCISDLQKNIGLSSPRMFNIPNPLNLKLIRNLAAEGQTTPVIPWLSPQKTAPCFITVGRLAQQKNHAMLLEAFKEVTNKVDARLIIIGQGDLLDELQAITSSLGLSDNVKFIGYKKNPYPYIKDADCFVLPSSEEGFGLVLVEAMTLGTPVVAFDSAGGGPMDILANGKYGVMVKDINAKSLADAMVKIISNKETLTYFHEQGLLRADFFRFETISKQWKDVLVTLGFVFDQKEINISAIQG